MILVISKIIYKEKKNKNKKENAIDNLLVGAWSGMNWRNFLPLRRERHYKKGVPQGNIMKVSSLVEGSFFYIKKKKGEDPTK